MCHLVLMMPVIGLASFWLWPPAIASTVYMVILALSIWLYWYVFKYSRAPIQIGMEKLQHAAGIVVASDGQRLRVRVDGETWGAESLDEAVVGDNVEVLGVDGLCLKVRLRNGRHRP